MQGMTHAPIDFEYPGVARLFTIPTGNTFGSHNAKHYRLPSLKIE
jgi:hypothetical protein